MASSIRAPRFDRRSAIGPAAFIVLGALCACARKAPDEDAWARAALARNATLDVGVDGFRRRHDHGAHEKSTGEVRTVHANELIAALPTDLPRATPSSTPATSEVPPSPPVAPPPPASVSSQAGTSVPATESSPLPTEPQRPAASPIPERPAPSTAGRVLASGPGYSISDDGAGPPPAPATKASSARVLSSGPGYSIRDAGPAPLAVTQAQSTQTDLPVRGVAVEQHHDPIICQGGRLLHIDNRNLEFDGDAVSAEDGCDLQITNSRISARGVAVSARGANVHIENSLIEGGPGAVLATDGAQVYAQQSTFKGVIRRADTAAFHDLGGNVGN